MSIELRPPRIEDLESYHEIFSDKQTHHFIIDEGLQDLEGSRNKLVKLIEMNSESLKHVYSICSDRGAVGFVVVHLSETDAPFISYAIRRSSQRNGYALHAIRNLIKIEKENFSGFKAATHLENKASQKLLRKIGFKEIGKKELEIGLRLVF